MLIGNVMEDILDVISTPLEFCREAQFALRPWIGVERTFNMDQVPALWVEADNVKFALKTTERALTDEDRLADEIALKFQPFTNQILKVVSHQDSPPFFLFIAS